MINPKISIIIPVYNGSNYLAEAIDSALAQTYKNIEIIVVNDGSNDDGATEKIALSYGDKILYFRKENGGSSSALNYGIKMMTGDYFSWLSHDDLYMPERIAHAVLHIDESNQEKQVVICGAKIIDSDGNEIFHPCVSIDKNQTSMDMLKLFIKGRSINGCSILIPRSIIEKNGFFDENLVYVNDMDYWYRFVINDYIFTYFSEKLVKTRIHSEQVSVKKKKLFEIEQKILDEKVLKALIEKNDKEKADIFIRKIAMDDNIDIIKKLKYKDYNYFEIMVWFIYGKFIKNLKLFYRKVFLKR